LEQVGQFLIGHVVGTARNGYQHQRHQPAASCRDGGHSPTRGRKSSGVWRWIVINQIETIQWVNTLVTALEGLSGAEAGAQLGMLVATVYTSKSKVQKLVREELGRLENPTP
jgi:hypothetical protein